MGFRRSVQRKSVKAQPGAGDSEVRSGFMSSGHKLPLVLQPKVSGLSLVNWAAANRERIDRDLLVYGGILFRGFEVGGAEMLESVIDAVADGALEYKERSSPRSQVHGNIYTSTDYPASEPIFLHNENSYKDSWPMKIFFYCAETSETGGETPIADTRRIYQKIAAATRHTFLEKKWSYVRNFGDGLGLHWRTVFQSDDRAEIDEYCREQGIETQWHDDQLRVRAIRPAAALHPRTGEPVWFNHATFFNISSLTEEIREGLLELYDEDEMPSNSFYGDGSPIESETLDTLRRLYHEETVLFRWQKEDVLLLDNMMVAHGRSPFTGSRKVVVGMAEPCNWTEIRQPSS